MGPPVRSDTGYHGRATSEATLTDFLERIKEWDGGHDNEMCAPGLPARPPWAASPWPWPCAIAR